MPLSADGTAAIDVESSDQQQQQQEKIEIETTTNINKHHQTLPVDSKQQQHHHHGTQNSTNTIEISGLTHDNMGTTTNGETEANVNNNEDNELDESSSLQCVYTYTEKFIEITRPINYNQRGFGFLLNTGVVEKKSNISNSSINTIIVKMDDNETTVINDRYAQVVVVEPG
jgi:hypothetical protein